MPRHATPRHATIGVRAFFALFVLALMVLAPSMSSAADFCTQAQPQDDWPGAVDCDGGGADDICKPVASGTQIQCDLARNDTEDPHEPAWIVAVYDADGDYALCGDEKYCIWGVDVLGNDFSCAFSHTDIEEVGVLGGLAGDETWFTYDDGTDVYDLDINPTVSSFTGRAGARAGDDLVIGSRSKDADYHDVLNGDNGDDTVCGREGADVVNGNNGDDKVLGEGGNDTSNGGPGTDEVCGNGGDDTVLGGDGSGDKVQGDGSGFDTVAGGPGFGDYCNADGDPSCEYVSLDDVCDITF